MDGPDAQVRSTPPASPPEPPVTPAPADPDRALWTEFLEAATVEAYCRAWLALQCRMIGGVRAGLVLLGPPDRGPFAPTTVWPHPQRSVKHLTGAAERAVLERRGLLLRQDSGGDADSPAREGCDVAYPVEVAGRLHGAVVLDLAPRPDPQLQTALRQLHWGCAWFEALFRREEALRAAAARHRLEGVLDLTATLLEHERFTAAAAAFVTALATRLACDRVSVGFVRNGRVRVLAVSHSGHAGKETNLIRAIEAAMEEALDQQAVLVHPPGADGAPLVCRAHAELARQQDSGAICSIPLTGGDRGLGALTLERSAERPFEPDTVALCEAVGAVAGPLLEVKRRDDRWLVAKAAEACRTQLARLIGPGHVGLKLAAAAVAGLAAFLTFATGEYRIAPRVAVEPAVRRAAVAPFDGYVVAAPARAGDVVREGQLLTALDDRDLRLQRLQLASQHEGLLKQYHQAMAAREAAQVRILAAQLDQAKAQLEQVEYQLSRTQVRVPFDGVVVTGDLSQALGAPVQRGQVLFEVAPLDAYRLILQVDEREVADVAVGQRGHLVLSAFPTERLPFTVEQVTPVSTAREGRNYFRVEARLETTPDRLRPGMEGIGKIEVGRRLLVWIWTHQVVDWLRLTLWAWLP